MNLTSEVKAVFQQNVSMIDIPISTSYMVSQ